MAIGWKMFEREREIFNHRHLESIRRILLIYELFIHPSGYNVLVPHITLSLLFIL